MKTRLLRSQTLLAQKGFTLLEMLVVLVIIGLLAGLVGPKLFSQVDEAKMKTAKTQAKMLKGVLEVMRLDISRFPTAEEGLNLLITAPTDEAIKPFWKGPYVEDGIIPVDPWNRPYQYDARTPSTGGLPFSLYSFGADGQAGGEGFDADIGYTPVQ